MLGYVILGAAFAFAAAVQPGVLQTYLISQSLTQGWRRTLPAAFCPLLSDGPVILVVLLVLTRLPASFLAMLRLAGGIFALYLAWGAYRAWRTSNAQIAAGRLSGPQTLLRATLVNLLNPNPYLAWSLVLGPLLLKAWREAPPRGMAFLAGFYGTVVLALAGLILLFATARKLGPRVSRGLVGVSAGALALFGAYLLWSGVRA